MDTIETRPELVADYRHWLQRQLQMRQTASPGYSLRSFARSLGLSPATLCQVMSGKRPISRKVALRIADGCNLNADERASFLLAALVSPWQYSSRNEGEAG